MHANSSRISRIGMNVLRLRNATTQRQRLSIGTRLSRWLRARAGIKRTPSHVSSAATTRIAAVAAATMYPVVETTARRTAQAQQVMVAMLLPQPVEAIRTEVVPTVITRAISSSRRRSSKIRKKSSSAVVSRKTPRVQRAYIFPDLDLYRKSNVIKSFSNLPPNQGGKYAGFGFTRDPPPKTQSQEIIDSTLTTLASGWSLFSSNASKLASTAKEKAVTTVNLASTKVNWQLILLFVEFSI